MTILISIKTWVNTCGLLYETLILVAVKNQYNAI